MIEYPEAGLTKEQAKQAIREGKKVSHRFFSSNEFIQRGEDAIIRLEDGVRLTAEFWAYRTGPNWETGWYIIE